MLPISNNYELYSDGQPIQVYHTSVADFAIVCFTGEKDFLISAKRPFESVQVRPERLRNSARLYGGGIRINMTDADRVSIEPYGRDNPLFILCAPYIPKPDNATYVFARGTHTDIGRLSLVSGDVVYIEEGAVVTGGFFAERAQDITITGNGMLWNAPLHSLARGERYYAMTFIDCQRVSISGVTVIDHPTWNIVPIACSDVVISGINIVGIVVSSDGIDIVGCDGVKVSHCFIYANDDCLVVKANRYRDQRGCRDVRDVRFSDCVLWNAKCGNAVEIGYETCCSEITDVTFEDIDIIHSELEGWQSGGVFTIHNGDRARIHGIVYRDIRVEEADEKLIDIKILSSKYSADRERGYVSDILFDGIRCGGDVLPPSIIRGWEPESGEPHLIENIRIRNLRLGERPIADARHAHLIAELTRSVVFE